MTSSPIDRRRAQAGAVSAMWLISIMILWGGTLALLYVTNADIAAADSGRDRALADKAEIEAKYDEQLEQRRATTALVGYNDTATFGSFSAPGAIQVQLDAAKSLAGPALGGADTKVTLENALQSLMTKVTGLNDQVATLQTQLKAAEDARDAANDRLSQIERTYQDQVAGLRQDLTDEQDRAKNQADGFERRLADLTDQQSAADATARDLQKTLDQAQADAVRAAATADQQLKAVAMRRAPVAPEKPDGEISAVSDSGTVAWIDLGRVHGLLTGTRFEVLRRGKQGELEHRGEVVVQSVENQMAQVAIAGTPDLFDPILPGDLVRSPFFDKTQELHYHLLGEFPLSASKELVTARLEALGGHVDSTLTVTTDVLVLGEKNLAEGEFAVELEETDTYQKAERLGLRIVRLDTLKDFLGY